MQARRGRTHHRVERAAHDVGNARKLTVAEHLRLVEHAFQLIVGHATKDCRRPFNGGRRDHDQIAQALEQILDETTRVLPRLHDAIRRSKCRSRVARTEGLHGLIDQLCTCEPEQAGRAFERH